MSGGRREDASESRPYRWRHWLPAGVWAATIFLLSAQPRLPRPPGSLTDKDAHALALGLLAAACLFGLTQGRLAAVTGARAALAATLAILYGVTDEWHQTFVPGRQADVFDVLADAVGACLVAALAWACAILLRRRDPRA